MTRRAAAGLGVAVLVLGLAACGGAGKDLASSPTASSTTTAPGAPAPPQASSLVLPLSAFPTGWAVDNSQSTAGSTCEAADPWAAKQKKIAASEDEVAFEGSSDGPEFIEDVLVYKNVQAATAGYTAITAQLDQCKTFHGSVQGTSYSGNVGAMSLGSYGDESSAFLVTTNVDNETIGQDEVFARKGSIVIGCAYGDYDPDVSTAQQLISAAVGRLP